MSGPDLTDHRCPAGLAGFWDQDGLWHVARPKRGISGLVWVYGTHPTKAAAVLALCGEEIEE